MMHVSVAHPRRERDVSKVKSNGERALSFGEFLSFCKRLTCCDTPIKHSPSHSAEGTKAAVDGDDYACDKG
jgi:hypothetical protein